MIQRPRLFALLLILLLGIAAMPSIPARTSPAPGCEFWLAHFHPQELAQPGYDWTYVREHLGALSLYINTLAFVAPQAEMEPVYREARAHGIPLAIEGGYFDWEPAIDDYTTSNPKPINDRTVTRMTPGAGERTARMEMDKMRHLVSIAGPPDFVSLDGPIRRLLFPGADLGRTTPAGTEQGFATLDEAIDEIIAYQRTLRAEWPQVRFILICNFPNWGWRGKPAYWASGGENGMFFGDYEPVVRRVLERTSAAGFPFDSLRADSPLEYTRGTFQVTPPWPEPTADRSQVNMLERLLELEQIVEQHGLKFELIINSQEGGYASNELFAERTREFFELYRQAGGSPARWMVQSWYRYPERLGPETEAGTLLHLIAGLMRDCTAK